MDAICMGFGYSASYVTRCFPGLLEPDITYAEAVSRIRQILTSQDRRIK